MDNALVRRFMQLAGQRLGVPMNEASPELRKLGAQLLLSETLEYVIRGLGVVPEINGVPITDANALSYKAASSPDDEEMLDGLADVAYTMFWNSCAFGLPLEEAYDIVARNNLEKFVRLEPSGRATGPVPRSEWDLGLGIVWPDEVVTVEILEVEGDSYAVGKDRHGKVRKPSSYTQVDLSALMKRVGNG